MSTINQSAKWKYSDDIRFVSAYLNGDRKVQQHLYKELQRLIRYFMKTMEHRGACFADKENTVAEIVYQILLKNDNHVLRAYDGRSKLTTYLWPIVRNRIIDTMRSEKKRRERISTDFKMEQTNDPPRPPSSDLQEIIHEFLTKESPLERFIKISKWVNGASYRDIIAQARQEFSRCAALNTQKIAYILHSNRKKIYKKLKKSYPDFDK